MTIDEGSYAHGEREGDGCHPPRRRSSILSCHSELTDCEDGSGRMPRRRSSVTFSEQIVSDVFDLPELDPDELDRKELFYEIDEIRNFKKDYKKKMKQKVRFSKKVSRRNRPAYTLEEVAALYYTPNDIRRFENEFLQSLDLSKQPSSAKESHNCEGNEMDFFNTKSACVIIGSRRLRELTDSTCAGNMNSRAKGGWKLVPRLPRLRQPRRSSASSIPSRPSAAASSSASSTRNPSNGSSRGRRSSAIAA